MFGTNQCFRMQFNISFFFFYGIITLSSSNSDPKVIFKNFNDQKFYFLNYKFNLYFESAIFFICCYNNINIQMVHIRFFTPVAIILSQDQRDELSPSLSYPFFLSIPILYIMCGKPLLGHVVEFCDSVLKITSVSVILFVSTNIFFGNDLGKGKMY